MQCHSTTQFATSNSWHNHANDIVTISSATSVDSDGIRVMRAGQHILSDVAWIEKYHTSCHVCLCMVPSHFLAEVAVDTLVTPTKGSIEHPRKNCIGSCVVTKARICAHASAGHWVRTAVLSVRVRMVTLFLVQSRKALMPCMLYGSPYSTGIVE